MVICSVPKRMNDEKVMALDVKSFIGKDLQQNCGLEYAGHWKGLGTRHE